MPVLISSATVIEAAGHPPKLIREWVGQVNTGTPAVSIAHMTSPQGWTEPGQKPSFDEYTLVLRGCLRVESHGETIDVQAGQAIHCEPGEWIRYSSPFEGGADYIAVCLPAFSLDSVHRDAE
jgi:quercetin dioxygenase-like cupin family protein